MHTYDIDSRERRNVAFVLAVLAIATAFVLHLVINLVGCDWWWIVDIPAPFGAFLLLYWLFDRWAWRNRWIRRVLGLRTPLLYGEWTGTLESSHDGKTHSFRLNIEQSWTRMSVCARGPQSRSSSKTASVLTRHGRHPLLVYTYFNEPAPDAPNTMHMHYGTAIHELDEDNQGLDGHYYTGRDRTTHGSMTLARKHQEPSGDRVAQPPPSS